MKTFLCSIDELLWTVIEDGYVDPGTINPNSSGVIVKARKDWTAEEINLKKADNKAKHCIFVALSEDERISVEQCSKRR